MDYVISTRFDILIKYYYVKSIIEDIKTNFFYKLYKLHIDTFNKNYEHPGTKNNIKDFVDEFHKIIDSIQKNGYNNKYPIEIGNNNVLINGSHRMATCLYLNINPKIEFKKDKGCETYHYDFFLNRNNYWRRDNEIYNSLDSIYTDFIALQYIRLYKNSNVIVLYPKTKKYLKSINFDTIISQKAYIYYKKKIKLSQNGFKNLLKEMYRGENWIGGFFPDNDRPQEKYDLCYNDNGEVIIYVVNFYNTNIQNLVEIKSHFRSFFPLEKHSLHIPDTNFEAYRIASSLLNENSINFLNNVNTGDFNSLTFKNIFNPSFYLNKNIPNEKFCFNSKISKLLKNETKNKSEKIFTTVQDDDVVYNPLNHFYFNGFKFQN